MLICYNFIVQIIELSYFMFVCTYYLIMEQIGLKGAFRVHPLYSVIL